MEKRDFINVNHTDHVIRACLVVGYTKTVKVKIYDLKTNAYIEVSFMRYIQTPSCIKL